MRRQLVWWCTVVAFMLEACCGDTYRGKMGIMVRLRGSDGQRLGDERDEVAGAALMAVKHVRERNTSLVLSGNLLRPDFDLDFELVDTRSEPLTGVEHAVAFNERPMDIVVGAARSAVSGPVSLVSGLTNTPVLSYSSTAAVLSTAAYPLFSRVIPNDSLPALSFVKVCNELGWKSVALLFIDDSYGQGYAQTMQNHAAQNGVKIVVAASFSAGHLETVDDAVRAVRDTGSRVIFCIAFSADVANIAAAATREGIVGRGYTWITGDSLTDPAQIVASAEEPDVVLNFFQGFLSINTKPLYGAKGDRFREVWDAEKGGLDMGPLSAAAGYPTEMKGDCSDLCGYIYDAVWAAAFAVSASLEPQGSASLELARGRVNEELRQLSFEGSTGNVAFDAQTGDRAPGGISVIFSNWVLGGSGSIAVLDVWEWHAGTGIRQIGPVPVWGGAVSGGNFTPPDGLSCEEGHVYSSEGMTCVACPPGSHEQAARCVACEVGKVAPNAGAAACVHCESGFAQREGMEQCEPCPPNTQRDSTTLGVNRSECKCVSNFYSPSNDADCVPCVPGAICPGQGQMPHPRYGFWGQKECEQFGGSMECDAERWLRFYECYPLNHCPGGANFTCEKGMTGRKCSEAEPDYFVVGGNFQFVCGPNGHVVSAVGILGVVATWWGLNKIVSSHYDALDIALLFVQTTGMISSYGFKWHPTVDVFNLVLSIANFDVDFVTPHCLMGWQKTYSFFLQLSLPLLFSFVVVVRCSVEHAWRKCRGVADHGWVHHMWQGAKRRFLTAAIVLYHTLCIRCFEVFRCESYPDGKSYLKFMPEMECGTPTHKAMIGISVIYIIVVILGTPLTIYLVIRMYKQKEMLHCPVAVKQWGFVHVRYEADWKYWETMLVLRRGIVAFLLVSMDSPMLKGAFTMISLTGLLSAHVFTRPYVDSQIDVLDFCSILGSMLYCLAGILSYPSITADTQGVVCTEGELDNPAECASELAVKYWISIITLVCVLITLGVSFVLAWVNVREKRFSERAAKIVYSQVIHRSEQLGDVSETTNKVSLCEILDGRFLLPWAKSLLPPKTEVNFSFRKVSNTSGASNDDALEAAVDRAPSEASVTRLGSSPLSPARRLRISLKQFRSSLGSHDSQPAPFPRSAVAYLELERRLRQIPIDLTDYSQDPTAEIIRKLCGIPGLCDWLSCAREEGKQGLRSFVREFTDFVAVDCENSKFPLTEVVREAYRPLMSYWLLESERDGMMLFWELMDEIQAVDAKAPMPLSTISSQNLGGAEEGGQRVDSARSGSKRSNASHKVSRQPAHVHPWQKKMEDEMEEYWDAKGDSITRQVMANKTSHQTALTFRPASSVPRSISLPDARMGTEGTGAALAHARGVPFPALSPVASRTAMSDETGTASPLGGLGTSFGSRRGLHLAVETSQADAATRRDADEGGVGREAARGMCDGVSQAGEADRTPANGLLSGTHGGEAAGRRGAALRGEGVCDVAAGRDRSELAPVIASNSVVADLEQLEKGGGVRPKVQVNGLGREKVAGGEEESAWGHGKSNGEGEVTENGHAHADANRTSPLLAPAPEPATALVSGGEEGADRQTAEAESDSSLGAEGAVKEETRKEGEAAVVPGGARDAGHEDQGNPGDAARMEITTLTAMATKGSSEAAAQQRSPLDFVSEWM